MTAEGNKDILAASFEKPKKKTQKARIDSPLTDDCPAVCQVTLWDKVSVFLRSQVRKL